MARGGLRTRLGSAASPDRGGSRLAPARPRKAGFTLVELLVVVSIVALLVGLLLPGLRLARGLARDALCSSNLRQASIGWTMYTNDAGLFPPRGPFDWGGVDFYDRVVWQGGLNPNRPINPYIGSNLNEKARAEIFLCPNDIGVHYFGDPTRARYSFANESTAGLEDKDDRIYGQLGTSYRANEWIWMKPGAPGMTSGAPNYNRTSGNRPEVVTDPARFVLVGDLGPFVVGRCARSLRQGVFGEWWHGEEQCTFAFLDGHAAKHQMTPGTADSREYTFYVAPALQPRTSWVYASSPVGTPSITN